jgi:hypothetical protein
LTALLKLPPVAFFKESGLVQIQVFVKSALGSGVGDLILGELAVFVHVPPGEGLSEGRHHFLLARIGFGGKRGEVNNIIRHDGRRFDLPWQAPYPPDLFTGAQVVA